MAKVHFEPIGEEIRYGEDATVLDAAYRQGAVPARIKVREVDCNGD
jgi:hypothetical protein